jgi:hypothetical protein
MVPLDGATISVVEAAKALLEEDAVASHLPEALVKDTTTVTCFVEKTTVVEEITMKEASTPIKLSGTKRSREEEEDTIVSSKVEGESTTAEVGSAATTTTVHSTVREGVVPRAYKKMKQAGTAFGVGMATGVVAGMVGTIVGLSSMALNESALS